MADTHATPFGKTSPALLVPRGGADFGTALVALCRITESKTPVIPIPKTGWPNAGQLTEVGGGSLAWRTLDAQYHGTPQRRRRIILVCDFAGQRAGRILFEPRGLPGYPAPGMDEGQAASGTVTINPDRAVFGFAYKASPSAGGIGLAPDIAPTLLGERADAAICLEGRMINRTSVKGPNGSGISWGVCPTLTTADRHAVMLNSRPQDCRIGLREDGIVQTLTHNMGTGGGNTPLLLCVAQGMANAEICHDLSPTLTCSHDKPYLVRSDRTIRRLTPTECARLQGFPDWWANLPTITDMTDEQYTFWSNIKQRQAKKSLVRWYNRLHTDSAEYKMWGNGVALPVVRVPIHGIAQLGAKTMGSLFDGSGGFPLAGLLDGIKTLWASEIEPYPIAVTQWNFGGRAQLLLGGATDE